nr:carbohydrate-binding domain-containing protein [uncultured Stomatobaculum sp.]
MSTHRKIDKICIAVLVLTLLLTAVFMNGKKLGIQVVSNEDSESYSGSSYFTENDLNGDWADSKYTTYITLDGSGGSISGNGAYFLDGDLIISNGGWYVISGSLEDGKIIVDAANSSKVWIRLNGVSINCSDDACLRINQADKVFLTLAEGTENSFTSGSSYSEEALADNTGGAIFSHDDLTINGSGSLTITAEYKHGIDVNDSLVITGGNITITAPQDGVHVNDSFRFANASLTVDAGDDGIHSDKELYVESGTILINSCVEGLEALTIDVAGGDITVYPSDDGFNANGGSTSMGGGMGGGMMGGPPDFESEADSNASESGESERSASETVETESSETESSGSESSGAERKMPAVTQAETSAADSSDSSTEEETYIRITGGKITVINTTGRDADGLDSNGSIYIDGGEIYISLPGEGSNSALDYGSESGGELIVTGGTVYAFGSSGMAEEFSSNSTQCAVLYNLDSAAEAGTEFRVLNENGEEVMSYTPTNSFSSVGFSSPALTLGETYTLVYGDNSAEITLDSVATSSGSSGGMRGGMGGGGTGGGGTPPDFGSSDSERPTPPNHSSESSEGSSGAFPERPSDGDRGAGPGSGSDAERESSEAETTAVATNFVSLDALDQKVWIELGGSALLLIAAIVIAMRYRKR